MKRSHLNPLHLGKWKKNQWNRPYEKELKWENLQPSTSEYVHPSKIPKHLPTAVKARLRRLEYEVFASSASGGAGVCASPWCVRMLYADWFRRPAVAQANPDLRTNQRRAHARTTVTHATR
ncbi:hypothetical protein EGR_11231 [Echinococcus granulosus]|uniref:Uncharacterized protein n=1 Tax=Echinococcus granulosus TaxID=6210 RepID=W6U0D1_ECHGR|nr:hypothetical protein EGR_11231 [Echinococcus granulosus]EUB53911.1 hypothetical protein EGR_11231 [Echinococcus granulosus]